MFLNYLVSLPIVDLSYALAFVMSLKTFSSINSAIAIHKFQEKGLKKSLPGQAYNLKTEYGSGIQIQIQT